MRPPFRHQPQTGYKAELGLHTENRIVAARRKAYDKKIASGDRHNARATTAEFSSGYDGIDWSDDRPSGMVVTSVKNARKTYVFKRAS
jgi:hypothetical protein